MDVTGVLALLGGVAIFVSLFGGGIEIERLKIPTVSGKIRLLSAFVGIALIGLSVWISNPHLISPESALASTPVSTLQSTQNLTVVDSFDESKFNQENWYVDYNPDMLTYSVTQSAGQACFHFTNPTQSTQEAQIRAKHAETIDILEADITNVSGNGEFGLDIWDEYDWHNLLICSKGQLRIAYSSFSADQEMQYPIQKMTYHAGINKLKVIYDLHEVQFFFDDIQLWSRPISSVVRGYGFDIRVKANSELFACVDTIRVQFIR